jgi:hypothetical protein
MGSMATKAEKFPEMDRYVMWVGCNSCTNIRIRDNDHLDES